MAPTSPLSTNGGSVMEGGNCGSLYGRRRSKADWAGVGLGDAFKPGIDYFTRLPAQRMFYAACRQAQIAAIRATGGTIKDASDLSIKPQLSPCYTSYPLTVAAHAAIGLTAFLEFHKRTKSHVVLELVRKDFLETLPAKYDEAEQALFLKVVEMVADIVQTRLFLFELEQWPGTHAVELYRLFSTAQQTTEFGCVSDIVKAVVLYGDLLPEWRDQNLHPLTQTLLTNLSVASRPFFDLIHEAPLEHHGRLAARWVHTICEKLKPFLKSKKGDGQERQSAGGETGTADSGEVAPHTFSQEDGPRYDDQPIAPLNAPQSPMLFSPPSAVDKVGTSLMSALEASVESQRVQENKATSVLNDFSKAIKQAVQQDTTWEDMRADLVEEALRTQDFSRGPVEGQPSDGHQITMSLGDEQAGGSIFDQPVELSEDFRACESLARTARPVTEALRRTLYPNVDELLEVERFRSSGSFDPARLPMAGVCQAVFRRHRVRMQVERRGSPVLLIACDGSGSLSRSQMQMLKILTTAWLDSTVRTGIHVMAGLYHSGQVRNGVSGPLVRWIYHPHKTPTISRRDAARAVASLPCDGTGVQSDALSLAFMLEEARNVARGRMIYLILLSDCEWNRSFGTHLTGEEEVRAAFQAAYAESKGRLHATLVALGVETTKPLSDLVDKVIAVPESQMEDPRAVAAKISAYVGSCVKERRAMIAER